DDVELKSLSAKGVKELRKDIGMIFQQFSLLERITVFENIALPLRCWKYKSRFIDQRVRELIKIVGLQDKTHEKPRSLSGGQKQRVAIARALTMNPKILLCDEATSALDPKTAESITHLLKNINREFGITIVFVTHQLSLLRRFCEEMAIIEDGRVSAHGNVETIFQQQPKSYINLIADDDFHPPIKNSEMTLSLTDDSFTQACLQKTARDLGIRFSIIGDGSESEEAPTESIILSISNEYYQTFTHYLDDQGVKFNILTHQSQAKHFAPKANKKEFYEVVMNPAQVRHPA
ncbi:ATP-binding cassette domain-containing protein, partial [bacterium]|nr:ATP-binding cassette domain-containing protein [bacterium]